MGKKVLIYGASYRDLSPWEVDALCEAFGDAISWYASKPTSHGAYRILYNTVKPDVVYLPSGHVEEMGHRYFGHMLSETPHCFFRKREGAPHELRRITSATLSGLLCSTPHIQK